MKVSLDLPDTVVGLDPAYLTEVLVATLYSIGKLSEAQASQALGLTLRAFEEMLPRYGFSILVDSQENLDIELRA